jgi:hypothetical protein
MIRNIIRIFTFFWAVLPVTLVCAQDLSNYRDFQLGMSLPKVVEQAGMKAAQVKLIHERPAVIQELEWRPGIPADSASSPDPVEEILFGFYNNQLYRIVIEYHRDNTEGLTDQDLIEAISAKYGKPTMPVATIISSSSSQPYPDSEKVLARWDNSEYSLNLFHFSYRSSYGMQIFSKRLDTLAMTAIAESIRLDNLEAPQREIERQKKEDEEKFTAGRKARTANKASFRP